MDSVRVVMAFCPTCSDPSWIGSGLDGYGYDSVTDIVS
jgi:hypothetical protein